MRGRDVLSVVVAVAVAAFVAGLLVGWQTDPSRPSAAATPPEPQLTRSPATAPGSTTKPTRVERLLAKFSCWSAGTPTSAAPPTHAVVTLPGHQAQLVEADVGFQIWLDHAPGVLHGFCP